MRFQLRILGGGQYAVVDSRTGQERYRGEIDGARAAQASLQAQHRASVLGH